jgi:hypothetical protein
MPADARGLSLSIDPAIIEIQAIAPSTSTNNITIYNKSNDKVSLRIELKPFRAKLEDGQLEYLNSKDFPILKDVQILDNDTVVQSIILEPSQQKILTLDINIPQDTIISDYYFSIVFISDNTSLLTSSTSSNQLGIASNVLLSVGPNEAPEGTINEFSSNLFFEKGPVPFTLKLENKGAHFIKPKGQILIKNMFGQSIGRLDLQSLNILANSVREVPNTLWKENFLLGYYTANLTLSLSEGGSAFTKSTHFIAFPFQGLILIVAIIIMAAVVNHRLKTRMKK